MGRVESPSTAFVGGSVFDGHSYLGPREVLVRDGRVVEVAAKVDRAGAEVVDLAGGLLAPGFIDAHVHAVQGGLERIRCDLSDLTTREEYLATGAGLRRGPSRRAVDPRRRLGHAGLSRRHADRRRSRHRRPRPTGLPAEPRSPRGLGQLPRARARRDRRVHPRSGARTHRAGRRAEPDRDAARRRDGRRRRAAPADHGCRDGRRPGRGAALPALARRHRVAGRHRRELRRRRRPGAGLRPSRPARRAHRAGLGCALVGPRRRRIAAAAPRRATSRAQPRAVPDTGGQDHAGRRRRELHRGHDRARTWTDAATPAGTGAIPSSIPRRCASTSDCSTSPASRSTSTRSATARSARRWTRSRARGATAGTTSRTSRS